MGLAAKKTLEVRGQPGGGSSAPQCRSNIGCAGADNRGDYLLGTRRSWCRLNSRVERKCCDGTAVITIDPTDVSIIVIAGVNGELDAKDAERAASAIADADVLLLQGEVGVEAARAAAVLAAASSTKIVLTQRLQRRGSSTLPLADVVIATAKKRKN